MSAMLVSECNVAKTRIARTLAAIARKSNTTSTILSFDAALMDRMIPPLVQLIKNGSDQAKKHSADFIGCITNDLCYISPVVASGVIGPLMSILHEQHANIVKQYAALALGNIAFVAEHAQTMLKMGVIKPLMQLLQCEPDGGEFSAMAIASLTFDAKCVDVMVEMGVVGPLVRLAHKGLVVWASKPLTQTTHTDSISFTRAWTVIALLSITGSDKHQSNQAATGALEFFKTHLPNCSADMKMEMAMALLETIEKQRSKRHVLQNAMTAALLDELPSNGSGKTAEYAKEAKRKLYAYHDDGDGSTVMPMAVLE